MLSNSSVYATIGVKDLDKAKEFYENKLSLKPSSKSSEDEMGGVMYDSGTTCIFVYQSSYGGTNQATSATWAVDDVEAEVNELKSKGVIFEHYDMPGVTLEGDVHVMGNMKSAWFKDPDGNILNINTN